MKVVLGFVLTGVKATADFPSYLALAALKNEYIENY